MNVKLGEIRRKETEVEGLPVIVVSPHTLGFRFGGEGRQRGKKKRSRTEGVREERIEMINTSEILMANPL